MTDIQVALFIAALFLIGAMVTMVYRIWKGPAAADRLNALFLIGTDTVLLLCIIGVLTGQIEYYVDLAITYALIGFISLVIIGRYITGRKTDIDAATVRPETGEPVSCDGLSPMEDPETQTVEETTALTEKNETEGTQ